MAIGRAIVVWNNCRQSKQQIRFSNTPENCKKLLEEFSLHIYKLKIFNPIFVALRMKIEYLNC